MMWNGWGMGWGALWMTLLGLLLLALVVAAAVAATRYAGRGTSKSTSSEQLLATRFARGEIDEQEYRTRLATLREFDTTSG